MTTTDHLAAARAFIGLVFPLDAAQEAGDAVARALVHATLALAAEQRTANQLALAALLPERSVVRQNIVDHHTNRLLVEDATP